MALTEDQQNRIRAAEEELGTSRAAHEEMRDFLTEPGRVGPPTQPLEWIGHVERLQRDVIKYLSTCIDVLAEAAGTSRTIESFRESIEQPTKDLVTHVLAMLDARDAGILREAISKFSENRAGEYIRRAEGTFPPAWMVATETQVPVSEAANAGSIGNTAGRQKPELADQATRKRRREAIRQSPKAKDLSMDQIADRFGVSTSSIYGMVTGDRSRYSDQKRLSFLNALGINPEKW